jgi:hypothetical protein
MRMHLLAAAIGVLLFTACADKGGQAVGNDTTSVTDTVNIMHLHETEETWLDRFNRWFQAANQPIVAGYEKASSEVELADGEEWGCDWDMDYRAVNDAVRAAIQSNAVLHPDIAKAWLAALDGSDARKEVMSIGQLFMAHPYGQKTAAFYLVDKSAHEENGMVHVQFTPEHICGGSTMMGVVEVRLGRMDGRLVLVEAKYVE